MLRAGRVVFLEVCDAFGMLRQVIEVIAKVESHDSVPNIEEIVAASDAVMVARGDLGARACFGNSPLCRAGAPIMQHHCCLSGRLHAGIAVAVHGAGC